MKAQILEFDRRIIAWRRSSATSKRLDAIPGVGPALATALVASIADPKEVVEADTSTSTDIPSALAALANEEVDVVVLQTNLLLNAAQATGSEFCKSG